MPKVQRRKPPKRKQSVQSWTEADRELAELALIIDECKLAQNASGWFALPWRDGINAARLALDVWLRDRLALPDKLNTHVTQEFAARIVRNDCSIETYEQAEEMRLLAPEHNALRVAARCMQLVISRSHGGGEIYNLHLGFLAERTQLTEQDVITWRCHDAIGVGPQLQHDANDRLRRAFVIAWKRGLFRAAYTLPQAKVI